MAIPVRIFACLSVAVLFVSAHAGTECLDSIAPPTEYRLLQGDSILSRTSYRPCGGLLSEEMLLRTPKGDTLLHGTRFWYDDKGRKASELNFLRGRKHGAARTFGDSGQVLWEAWYSQDRLDSVERTWDPKTGVLLSETGWDWGMQHGRERHWDSSGRIRASCRWSYGKIEGDSVVFAPDGSVQHTVPYRSGRQEGTEEWFDSDGNTEAFVHWRKGRKEGEEKQWWEPKHLRLSRRWKNDTLHGWEMAYDQRGLLEYRRLWIHGNAMQEYRPPRLPPPPMPEEANGLVDEPWDPLQPEDGFHEGELSFAQDSTWISAQTPIWRAPQGPRDSTVHHGDTVFVFDSKGRLRSETRIVNGKWQGTHRLWRKGVLFISLEFLDDTLEGAARMYHSNGTVREEIPYHKGKIEGTVREFRPDGSLSAEYQYRNDKREGTSRGWHENGKARFELTYANGNKEGLQHNWFSNGKLRSEIHWSQGRLHGTKKAWSEKGLLLESSVFAYDVCLSGDCDLQSGKGSPFDVE